MKQTSGDLDPDQCVATHNYQYQKNIKSKKPVTKKRQLGVKYGIDMGDAKGFGYGKYYIGPQAVTYENEYWNPMEKKTYSELHQYYKSPEFFNEEGYYSAEYQTKYYDGYGLNHYYGNFGYYEYSRAPTKPSTLKWSLGKFASFYGGMILILVVLVFGYIKCS